MKSGTSRRTSSRQERTRSKETERGGANVRSSADSETMPRAVGAESNARVPSPGSDSASPTSGARVSDFARLEAAVRALARSHALVRAENHALRGQLEVKERQIAAMEVEASEVEGRRKHAIDRLDELLAEVEALESQCDAAAPGEAAGRVAPLSVATDVTVNASTRAGA
jgi:hypothetical protein